MAESRVEVIKAGTAGDTSRGVERDDLQGSAHAIVYLREPENGGTMEMVICYTSACECRGGKNYEVRSFGRQAALEWLNRIARNLRNRG